MICEELGHEITAETCSNMRRHKWCEWSCDEKMAMLKNGNGGNVETPQPLPEIIAPQGQISEITPKEGQSTPDIPKTILGHSGKAKGEILGRCEKRDEELTWGCCSQRRRRDAVEECQGCDQKPFQFFEQPMGSGWHNSAARAGERECLELGGRKIKKGTCLMRAGKKSKAGKSCIVTCQYWKGEKMKEPSRTLITMWCPTCQAERAGWTNQKTRCGECEAELQARQPMIYFCPTPYCAHQVEVEGMLCGDCQIEGLKKVEGPNINPAKPNHVKLVGLNSTIMGLLKRWEEYQNQVDDIMIKISNTTHQIVIELQKAVKSEP